MMTKEEKRKRAQERADRLTSQGLCVVCREPVGRERIGKRYCNMCKATYRGYRATWNDNHPEARDRHRKYTKERYERYKAEHRCTICGTVLEESRTVLKCPDCTRKYSNLSKRRYARAN